MEITRYLRAREQVKGVYREIHLPAELIEGVGGRVSALAYVAERAHPNYAGQLPPSVQGRLIHEAQGLSGTNLDYLISTLRHLQELGIRERELERLLGIIAPHAARCAIAGKSSPHAAAMLRHARLRPPARRMRTGNDRRFLYRQRLSV